MRRLRTVFVLVALVLLVPVGLLIRWALENVAAEDAARHRAVAERIFDEMERELTALLHREEARPFGEYRYNYVPARSVRGKVGLTRSPLADTPAESYIVGYFQIEPDGTFGSPRIPETGTEDGWVPSSEVRARVDELYERVRARWERLTRQQASAWTSRSQRPGTTVALGNRLRSSGSQQAGSSAGAAADEASPYSQLQALNRGVVGRGSRAAKLTQSPAQNIYRYAGGKTADELGARLSASALREAEKAGPGTPVDSTESQASGWLEPRWKRPADPDAEVEVQLEPMVAALLDAQHIALYRAVFVGGQAYRQGFVIDVPTLTAHLTRVALGEDRPSLPGRDAAGLARYATLRFFTNGDAPSIPAGGFAFLHRFAEPFGLLAATLSLEPLPGDLGAAYIYALSCLLVFVATGGLFALYRMVSVAVAFAERRNNFVSAVSHELKTPLTSIRMYGEMLRDGIVDSEEKRGQYYETITAESERLTRLINNVLELSRLEKKGRPMTMVAGEVAPVLQEVVDILGPHASKEGFTLALEVAGDLPAAWFDRDALLQVLLNLVDNAFKYARDAADKRIVVAARRERDGVILSVRDRGPGVASRHIRKIFEPFYRGENELTRRTKGTGIGLALVRGLVERMGGRVTGRNLPDGGFEVGVSLQPAPA